VLIETSASAILRVFTCFSSGVNGVAHGFFARDTLLRGERALKSGDSLMNGDGARDNRYGSSSDCGKRSDKEDFDKHLGEMYSSFRQRF
jgi:hypothetical protein